VDAFNTAVCIMRRMLTGPRVVWASADGCWQIARFLLRHTHT